MTILAPEPRLANDRRCDRVPSSPPAVYSNTLFVFQAFWLSAHLRARGTYSHVQRRNQLIIQRDPRLTILGSSATVDIYCRT